MITSAPEANHEASVTYEWYVDDMAPVEQKQHGRRVKIAPRRVWVTANRKRDGNLLTVYIDGQTIRQNGTPGQQRRIVAYSTGVQRYFSGELISEMPPEYQPFLDAARSAEAHR